MKKRFSNSLMLSSFITSSLIFTACTQEEAKVVSKDDPVVQEIKTKVIYDKNNDVVASTFKDTAKVGPDGKYMILIFGTNTDPYTDRLKADIKNSKELEKKIKQEFSSYYFKAHENLRHKLFHEKEYMDVDTKTMISIYAIEATPTIIFTDKNGKAVIVVPGYMPAKQFQVTMDFMNSKNWEGKDRKNGEVYEALRDFYIKNGIDVRKKDK